MTTRVETAEWMASHKCTHGHRNWLGACVDCIMEFCNEAEARGAEKALRAAAACIEEHPAGRLEIKGDGAAPERAWKITADAAALAGCIRALSPAEIVKEAP